MRIKLIAVTLLAAVLCACSPATLDTPIDTSGTSAETVFDDGGLVEGENQFIYVAPWYGHIIQYDLINKKAAVACPDPLCDHGDDCPVNIVFVYTVSDKYIAYIRGMISKEICYYNLNAGKVIKIMDCVSAQTPGIAGDNILFAASTMEYDEDGAPIGEIWSMYRYNILTSELEMISDTPLANAVAFMMYKNEDMLWLDMGTPYTYFTTDKEFKNKKESNDRIIIGNYKYDFEWIYGDDGSAIGTIKRINLSNGTDEEIAHGVYSARFDNYKDPCGIIFITYHNDDGRTLFYYDAHEEVIKTLCTVPEGYEITEVLPGNYAYIGNYIAVGIFRTGADHEEAENSESMLFVNVKTGENFVLAP